MDASEARRLAAGTFEPSETSEVDKIAVRRAGSPTPSSFLSLSRRASDASTGSQLFFDAQSNDGDDNNNNNKNNSKNQKNGTSVSVLTNVKLSNQTIGVFVGAALMWLSWVA